MIVALIGKGTVRQVAAWCGMHRSTVHRVLAEQALALRTVTQEERYMEGEASLPAGHHLTWTAISSHPYSQQEAAC